MSDITVDHVDMIGIPTKDADKALEFYTEVLGLTRDKKAKYDVWAGNQCFSIWEPESRGQKFEPSNNPPAFHVADVPAARAILEEKGVTFYGDTIDTSVCHMAMFADPDGNSLMLHNRYSPRD